jgi:hypothetical protein
LKLPWRWLNAYARALPRLEAEEELRMVRAFAAPYMEKPERARYLEELERAIRPVRRGIYGSQAVRAWFAAAGLPVGS